MVKIVNSFRNQKLTAIIILILFSLITLTGISPLHGHASLAVGMAQHCPVCTFENSLFSYLPDFIFWSCISLFLLTITLLSGIGYTLSHTHAEHSHPPHKPCRVCMGKQVLLGSIPAELTLLWVALVSFIWFIPEPDKPLIQYFYDPQSPRAPPLSV